MEVKLFKLLEQTRLRMLLMTLPPVQTVFFLPWNSSFVHCAMNYDDLYLGLLLSMVLVAQHSRDSTCEEYVVMCVREQRLMCNITLSYNPCNVPLT